MKKFASVLLAVLVAFSMFSFVVSAADVTLSVKADKTNVKVGDTVKVAVSLSKDSGIGALTVDLVYDASVFEVVSLTSGTLFEMPMPNANFASGKARFVAIQSAEGGVVASGTVFTVEFKAVKDGEGAFSLLVDEAAGDDGAITVSTGKDTVVVGATEKPTEKPSETPSEKPSEEPSTEKPFEEPSTDKPTEPEDPCKDGHDYNKPMVVSKATCKKAGISQKTCKVCGDKVEEAIPATGKCEPGAWKVVKAATTTAEGEKVQECKYCGEVLQRAKIAKLPSNPITNPAIPNTDAQA